MSGSMVVSMRIACFLIAGFAICSAVRARASTDFQIPILFEENRVQADGAFRFVSRGSGYTLLLGSREVVLTLESRGHRARALHMRWIGGSAAPLVQGSDPEPGVTNYLIGRDPRRWRIAIPHYSKVIYRDIYPGINLAFHGHASQLEYDFVVAAGADPARIQVSFDGADRIRIQDSGELVVAVGDRELRQRCQAIYQEIDGVRKPVNGRFILAPGGRIGFEVGRHDPHAPLVIDPVVSFATYFGGQGNEGAKAIAVDGAGNTYIAGGSTLAGILMTDQVGSATFSPKAFVVKLNSAGTAVLYATYFGGSDAEIAWGLAVDAAGNAYVTGSTFSTDFPVTDGAVQPVMANGAPLTPGDRDAFVVKLDPTGSRLLYSTYLGGQNQDVGFNIVVDSFGYTYVSGTTVSPDFPRTAGALGAQRDRGFFLSKLDAAGKKLVYSGILCAYSDFGVGGMAVDPAGNVYVTGMVEGSDANDFPITTNAFQSKPAGSRSAYFMKVNSTATDVAYSTFLGGAGGSVGIGIAVDAAGNAVLTGLAWTGFPTTPGALALPEGTSISSDPTGIFVTKINPAEGNLIYSAMLGDGYPENVALDSSGNVYVAGMTLSAALPVTSDAAQSKYGDQGDGFLLKLIADGSALTYGTYLGGSNFDEVRGLVLDPAGSVYLGGTTLSPDLSVTPSALQERYGGNVDNAPANYNALGDAFVVKLTDVANPLPQVTTVSAASYARVSALAPAAIASAFGSGLSNAIEAAASVPLPTILSGTSVRVLDSSQVEHPAQLFFVSPGQINYLVPEDAALGPATISVLRSDRVIATGTLQIQDVAPGLFSANATGTGVAAALAIRVKADGTQHPESIYHCGGSPVACVADPIDLGPESDRVILELFGTGIRGFSDLSSVTATIGLDPAAILGAAAQSQYAGLDQVNVLIPRSLRGRGEVDVVLNVDGRITNQVTINVGGKP